MRNEYKPRGYLFVEKVDILGIRVVWIFTKPVRYAVKNVKRKA
jgi:hypothetical protein